MKTGLRQLRAGCTVTQEKWQLGGYSGTSRWVVTVLHRAGRLQCYIALGGYRLLIVTVEGWETWLSMARESTSIASLETLGIQWISVVKLRDELEMTHFLR